MRVAVVLVLLAALVGGFFMPVSTQATVAEHVNGSKSEPLISVTLLGIHPLQEGRVLIVSLIETEGIRGLLIELQRADGVRVGGVLPW